MVHARQTRKEGNITGAQTISIPKQTSNIQQSVISSQHTPGLSAQPGEHLGRGVVVQVVAVQAVKAVDGAGAGVDVEVEGARAGDLGPRLNSLP